MPNCERWPSIVRLLRDYRCPCVCGKLWFPLSILFWSCCAGAWARQLPKNPPAKSADLVSSDSWIIPDAVSLRSFNTALASLSQQSKTTILAEGIPLHPTLTEAQATELSRALSANSRVPLGDAVERVAAAFDYEVERPDDRTFLLRKRYTDAADLPCITYGEILHALRAIDRIVSDYAAPSGFGQDSPRSRLFDSLSPEQVAVARTGITLSALDDSQRELALTIISHVLLENKANFLRQALTSVQGLSHRRTRFTWMLINGVSTFGYEEAVGPKGYIQQFPLSSSFFSQAVKNATRLSDTYDPTPANQNWLMPTAQDEELAEGMLAHRLPSTRTIAEAAAMGNADEVREIHITVDANIAEKPVCLFGDEYSSHTHLLRSLTALYGLQLLTPHDDEFTITLPTARPAHIGEVPAAIQRLYPLPLSRALRAQSAKAARLEKPLLLEPDPENVGEGLKETLEQHHQRMEQQEAMIKALPLAADALGFPAVRRLIVLALPRVPIEQAPPVPLIDCKPEVLRLAALAQLSGQPLLDMEALSHLAIPAALADPNTMKLMISKTERTTERGTSTSLMFAIIDGPPDAKGRLRIGLGAFSFGRATAQ